MEKPFLKTPVYGIISVSVDTSVTVQKPLPSSPTNVPPSSVYSTSKEESMDPLQRHRHDAILPPHIFLQPTTYSSSTSRLPDSIPLRPQLGRNEQLFPVSDSSVEKRRAQEASSGNLPLSSPEHTPARLSNGYPLKSSSNIRHSSRVKSAEQHAGIYESVLHTRSPAMPTFNPEPYYAKASPSAMTARITDVVDTSLCPSPLRISGSYQKEVETSRFSSSSSDNDGTGFRNSIKSRAKKALHLRRSSTEIPEQRPSSSRPSSAKPPNHRRQSSLQQGLSDGIYDMYETLTSLSVAPSPKPKPTTETSKSRPTSDLRSPAMPTKAAKILGTRLSDAPVKSPLSPKTPKTPRSAKFAQHGHQSSYASVPFSENYLRPVTPVKDAEREPSSVAEKLAMVFQNGTQSIEAVVGLGPEKGRRTKAERRREELKKRIVIVGAEERGF